MHHKNCVYYNCKNTSREISMFRFPVRDQGRLNLWIRNAGNALLNSLSNDELKNRHICAAHFPEPSLHRGNMRSRLLGPAVPIPFSTENTEDATSNDHYIKIEPPPSPIFLNEMTPTKYAVPSENTESSPSTSSIPPDPLLVSPPHQKTIRTSLFEGHKRLSMKGILKKNENDPPQTKRLKSTVAILIKRNKALRARIYRLRTKVRQYRDKENVREDNPKAVLVNMQKRNTKMKKAWSEAEKKFCLSLFSKSSATYKFLRKQGIVLAAPTTIKLWLHKSSNSPEPAGPCGVTDQSPSEQKMIREHS